jgi:hypothetical protein
MELIALSEFIAIFLLLAESINYLDSHGIVAPVCGIGDVQRAHADRGAAKVTARQDYFDDAA